MRPMPDDPAMLPIPVMTLPHFDGLPLPRYQSSLAAGLDLVAATEHDVVLASMDRALIATGLRIALPPGYEAQIRPRSGLALKHGITCLNTPGTIDADYRGEIRVLLINLGGDTFTITRGLRIAQLVLARHATIAWQPVDALDDTARGQAGFGSTGT